jgi:hypothetical protein
MIRRVSSTPIGVPRSGFVSGLFTLPLALQVEFTDSNFVGGCLDFSASASRAGRYSARTRGTGSIKMPVTAARRLREVDV